MSLKYLESLEKFGIHLGLERIEYLLGQLGNPHLKFKSLHVAGTNGKGSTSAMIAAVLKEAGYKVGLYTSPHLLDYTERIKINGQDISRKRFFYGLKKVKKLAVTMRDKPTVFEVLTAVAFWYFAEEKVDFAVVEVGMGGRLDSTNVITPLVSVITNIDYEHTEILGESLSKIAKEKGGIIKKGVPVVTAENKSEPLRVMKSIAERKNALLIAVSHQPAAINSNLIGTHQRVNAACAIAAIRIAGIKVSKKSIQSGLSKVRWPGRFQVISRNPFILLDGAHNPAGIKTLQVTILEQLPGIKFTVIFGCQKDKDASKMLSCLRAIASKIIVTRSSHNNAVNSRKLSKYIKKDVLTDSLLQALAYWDKASPLIITGSLFLVADALKVFNCQFKLDGFKRLL